jgi:predicted RNA-binding protein with EMAP domain
MGGSIKPEPMRPVLLEKGISKEIKNSAEQVSEQGSGWRPGGKEEFDLALRNKDAKIIKSLLPKIPEAYKQQFASKIEGIVGKSIFNAKEEKELFEKGISSEIPVINLERLNISPSAKQSITDIAKQLESEFKDLKGGVLSNEQVIETAKMSDILVKVTSKETTLKSEAMLLKTRQQLAQLAKEEKITPEFINTLKIVKAEATRRGRELQALGIEADPILGNIKSKVVKKLLDIGKGVDEIIELSRGVNFNNAQQVTDFYRKFVKPTLPELIDEYRYINLLSSPKTHIVNAFSNALQVVGLRPATRLASGMIDTVASKLTGKEQEYYVKQVPAYYKGVYNSIGDAVKGFTDSLKGKTLIYRPDLSRIPTNSKLLKPFQYIPRLLEGTDIFFRTLAIGGEMEALLKIGINETSAIKKATEIANELVFRKALDAKNKTGQGLILSTIDKLTSAVYRLRSVPGVKWFVPFVQTPMNILKQGIEYSPLGVTTLIGNSNKIEQLAKSLIGSIIFLGAFWLAFKDRSTWAVPTNKKQKEAFYDAGLQPYSIKVGNEWIAYSKLGPIAYPIAMSSAIKYYLKDNPKSVTDTNLAKTSKILSGISQFLADQSYLEGIGNFIDVARGDSTAVGRIASNIPSQLMPLTSLQRWVANLIDPVYRKAESGLSVEAIIQNLQKGIPYASKNLEPYKTPSGEVSKRQMPILNALSPITITKEKPESKDLFDLMQQTSKESNLLSRQKEQFNKSVEAEYNRLKTIPKEQAKKEFDDLIKNNPDMAKIINSLIKEEQKNLNPMDNLLLSLGVENGLRAKIIKDQLNKLKTKEEKKTYYQELIDKKIINKQVNEQLLRILELE